MGMKAGSLWMVALGLWLALQCCSTTAMAQHQGGKASHLSHVKETQKPAGGTELFTGSVLALAALLLIFVALAARPRRYKIARTEARHLSQCKPSGPACQPSAPCSDRHGQPGSRTPVQ